MDAWISDRISFGYWVSPADEVAQPANPPTVPAIHMPIPEIAERLLHPFPDHPDIPQAEESAGYMNFDIANKALNPDLFLPPHDLLAELDSLYADKLQGALMPPFREIVAGLVELSNGNKDKAEKMATNMSGNDLLEILRRGFVWYKNGLALLYRQQRGVATGVRSEESSSTIDNDNTENRGYGTKMKYEYNDNDLDDNQSEEGLEYYDHEDEYASESDTAESIRIEHYEETNDEMDTGLNVYGIEEVMPSSPQTATDGNNDNEGESNNMITETKIGAISERTGRSVIVNRPSETWLGKRKEAPEGLKCEKASKERKSESPRSVSDLPGSKR
jgi:hypothetical protein